MRAKFDDIGNVVPRKKSPKITVFEVKIRAVIGQAGFSRHLLLLTKKSPHWANCLFMHLLAYIQKVYFSRLLSNSTHHNIMVK